MIIRVHGPRGLFASPRVVDLKTNRRSFISCATLTAAGIATSATKRAFGSYAALSGPIVSADWHFWTTDPAEKDLYTTPGYAWVEEGSFWAPKASEKTVPVYRLYSKSRNHHFWTSHLPEANKVAAYADFVNEGAKYNVFPIKQPGTVPLERYYFTAPTGEYFQHFYTPTPSSEILAGWGAEGPIGFVYESDPQDPLAKAKAEQVHRYNARVVTRNWACSIQSRNHIEHYRKNLDNMTRDQAEEECKRYLHFTGTADKNAGSYVTLVVPR